MEVHQFHPTLRYGDAVSDHIVSLQRLLRGLGYNSGIFCEYKPDRFRGRVQYMESYAEYSSPESVLLLHFSLGYSPETLDWIGKVQARKVLVYHNVTPHRYFAGVSDAYLEAAKRGREQLACLRPLVEAGWGVSGFNCQELAAQGWARTDVLPIVFEPGRYAVRPARRVLRRYRDGPNVLFVGRVSPNKCLEDLISTFYHLKRRVMPDARLVLVGSALGTRTYLEYLRELTEQLGLSDVVFAGHVSTSELVAYYQTASVYLCMSEHEGFGVPFTESMHFGVPIIAYKGSAVPETLGGSGILVMTRDYPLIAELIGLVIEDEALRDRIVARQRVRLASFTPQAVRERLAALLRDLGV